jgi:RNA polymerase sigma-70 factor, ECF subfamily
MSLPYSQRPRVARRAMRPAHADDDALYSPAPLPSVPSGGASEGRLVHSGDDAHTAGSRRQPPGRGIRRDGTDPALAGELRWSNRRDRDAARSGQGPWMTDAPEMIALYRRCTAQDRAAFAELFRRYHRRVLGTALFITHREDAAEEIVQLVFIELFTAFRRFDAGRPFLPWLYRIIHDVSMDYLRRDRRGAHLPLPASEWRLDALLGADPDPGPAEHAERAELHEEIWRALERLPANHRAVLVLRHYSQLSEAEMAQALGCRRGTIKSRLHRAHRALAAELDERQRAAATPWVGEAITGRMRVALAER